MDQSLRQSIKNASDVGAVFGGDLAMHYHTRNHPDLAQQEIKSFIGYIPAHQVFPAQLLAQGVQWRAHELAKVTFDELRADSVSPDGINLVSAGALLAILVRDWDAADERDTKIECEKNILRLSLCLNEEELYKAFGLLGKIGVATYKRAVSAAGISLP